MNKYILTVFFLITSCLTLFAQSFQLDEYNCWINIQENGDLVIKEESQCQFLEPNINQFSRKIPSKATDGIEFVSASVVSKQKTPVDHKLKHIAERKQMVVNWVFEPDQDKILTFELEYIAHHVCYIKDNLLVIEYQPLPLQHDHQIHKGSIELIFPEKLPPIMGIFNSTSNKVFSSITENSIIYSFRDLVEDEVFAVGMAAIMDFLPIEKPHWQDVDDKQILYGKFFLPLMGIVFAIILYMLYNMKKKAEREKLVQIEEAELPEEISSFHPALLMGLLNKTTDIKKLTAAVILRLIRKKILKVSEFQKGNYGLEVVDQIEKQGFEQRLFMIIKKLLPGGKASLGQVMKRTSSIRQNIEEEVSRRLIELDLADGEKCKEKSRALKRNNILLVIDLILMIIGMMRFSQGFPYIIYFSVFLMVFILYLIYRVNTIDIYTDLGRETKHSWKLWKKEMLNKMEEKPQFLTAKEFDEAFLYSVSMDFADSYLRHIWGSGINLDESILQQSFASEEELIKFLKKLVSLTNKHA